MSAGDESLPFVRNACRVAGLSSDGAEPIRIAENAIWRLEGGVVARVTREDSALREIQIARWLAENEMPAVKPFRDVEPVEVEGRLVSFWEELPPHQKGTFINMAVLLRKLHSFPVPDFLSVLDPFASLERRLNEVKSPGQDNQAWMLEYLKDLRSEWTVLAGGLPHCVIHGDAWSGNCAVSELDGTAYLLDFDRVAVGPPEWDLTSIAIALTLGGPIDREGYDRFCELYGGYDVTTWSGYPCMRAIRELRMTVWSASVAEVRPEWRDEVLYRIDCLRGRRGDRPWKWTAIL